MDREQMQRCLDGVAAYTFGQKGKAWAQANGVPPRPATCDLRKYSALPFASTLNGSCTAVCPVRIDIHDQIYKCARSLPNATRRHSPRSRP